MKNGINKVALVDIYSTLHPQVQTAHYVQISANETFIKYIAIVQAIKQISRNLKELKLHNVSSMVIMQSVTEKYLDIF